MDQWPHPDVGEAWPYRDVDATARRYAAAGMELRAFLAAQAGRLTADYYDRMLGPLYAAGAERVWVSGVEECDDQFWMVHQVAVELPREPAARSAVLAAAAAIAQSIEPGAEPSVGDRFAVLHTGE
jgi:hypothetical protein